jgi:hypothetical protein
LPGGATIHLKTDNKKIKGKKPSKSATWFYINDVAAMFYTGVTTVPSKLCQPNNLRCFVRLKKNYNCPAAGYGEDI